MMMIEVELVSKYVMIMMMMMMMMMMMIIIMMMMIPIEVTLLGIVTSVSSVHPSKA